MGDRRGGRPEKGERSKHAETRERSSDRQEDAEEGTQTRGRDGGERSKVRSRPGPVATMRLYSQSPSPPPELAQWKQRESRGEERRVEPRREEVEVKVEDEQVVNAKPNNEKEEKKSSDDSSVGENEA